MVDRLLLVVRGRCLGDLADCVRTVPDKCSTARVDPCTSLRRMLDRSVLYAFDAEGLLSLRASITTTCSASVRPSSYRTASTFS